MDAVGVGCLPPRLAPQSQNQIPPAPATPGSGRELRQSPDAGQFIILEATVDAGELRLTLSALDAVLHTSSIGESFGYGIAEPMNLGKPVITHSTPWSDQAQIELVREGECGFVASAPPPWRGDLSRPMTPACAGAWARERSTICAWQSRMFGGATRSIFRAAIEKRDNPFAAEDLQRARETAAYLDADQFGHSFAEQIALRPFYSACGFTSSERRFAVSD